MNDLLYIVNDLLYIVKQTKSKNSVAVLTNYILTYSVSFFIFCQKRRNKGVVSCYETLH